MCQFRMMLHVARPGGELGLVKKPTGFMTSSKCIATELDKKCDGGHSHVLLVAGRVSAAQVYPDMLCEAICRGVVNQKKFDKSNLVITGKLSYMGLKKFVRHVCELQGSSTDLVEKILSTSLSEGVRRPTGNYPQNWVDDWHEEYGGNDHHGVRPQVGVTLLQKEMDGLSFKSGYEVAWDDVTNAELLPDLVKNAHEVEMGYFAKLGVYEYATHADQQMTMGKII